MNVAMSESYVVLHVFWMYCAH